jgi:hypothetical protein
MSATDRSPTLESTTARGWGSGPTLKLYGDNLASAGARFWIVCASILIVIMATAEAVAWGYVASFFGESLWLRVLASGFVGLSVFAIIWILDATFMTLDLKRSRYEESLHNRSMDNRNGDRVRFWTGIASRLLLVSGSLYLSAPFVAQLIFQQDIDSRIQVLNASRVSQQRSLLEAEGVQRLESLQAQQRQLEEQRIAEAAGQGPSGRYGRGPAVRTIELRLEELAGEIATAKQEQSAELFAFDQLTPDQIEQRYGVGLLGRGLQTRGEVLDQILAEDSYQNAELAVRAFLFFLFVGLLILKLFQPRSVEVYYSEQLQSLYRRYLGGAFDPVLEPAERPDGTAPMDALRFEDWCLNTYGLQRNEESQRRARAQQLQEFEERVETLKRVAEHSQSELDPIVERHRAGRFRVRELDEELESLRSDFDQDSSALEQQRGHLAAIDHNLRDGRLDEAAFKTAARVRSELASSEAALTERLRAIEARRQQIARQREGEVAGLTSLDRELAVKRSLLDGIDATLRSSRQQYIAGLIPGEGPGKSSEAAAQIEPGAGPWQARLLQDGRQGRPKAG